MSKKDSIFASPFGFKPILQTHFSPTQTIPGQDLKLSDLVRRFSRGEPLLCHTNPITDSVGEDEDFDDAPPEGQDLCEAFAEMQTLRTKKKQAQRQQAEELQQQQQQAQEQHKQEQQQQQPPAE